MFVWQETSVCVTDTTLPMPGNAPLWSNVAMLWSRFLAHHWTKDPFDKTWKWSKSFPSTAWQYNLTYLGIWRIQALKDVQLNILSPFFTLSWLQIQRVKKALFRYSCFRIHVIKNCINPCIRVGFQFKFSNSLNLDILGSCYCGS